MIIRCSGGYPRRCGAAGAGCGLVRFDSTEDVPTSRFIDEPGFNTLTDAALFVDDPAPNKQTLCLPQQGSDTCPGSRIGSGDGRRTYDPDFNPAGPRRGNAWLGSIRVGRLLFAGIPVDPPGAGLERIFRITGIRVNAAQLEVQPGKQAEVGLLSQFGLEGIPQFALSTGGAARVQKSVDFSIQGPKTLYQCEAANNSFQTNPSTNQVEEFATITALFREEFGHASAGPINVITPTGNNDFHGSNYLYTGFSRRKTHPQWPRDVGFQDAGSEFIMQFANVPSGVDLWAEKEVTGATIAARMVDALLNPNRYVQVPVVNGLAELRYQVNTSDYRQLETLPVKVAVSYPAGRAALGTVSVKGYAGPINKFPSRDVSRFFGAFPEDPARAGIAAFTINDCASKTVVRPRFAVTTGFIPVNVNLQGNAAEEGKFYVLSDGAPNTGIRLEGPSASWLRTTLNSNVTPATIDLAIDPEAAANDALNLRAALGPGNYSGTFRILSDGGNPAAITVPLVVNPPGPHLTRWGVANTASYESEAVAPGEALTIFGERFGPGTLVTAQIVDGKFSTNIGETRVLFDGVAAPMIYAARGQVSAIAPFALSGKRGTRVQVEYQGVRSPAVSVPVAAAVPGLLTANASGSGKAAALNQDNSFNSVSGALPGEYVVFFGVGGPPTDTPGRDGELYQAPLPKFTGPVTVLLNGVAVPAADIAYIGPAPGLVQGVWQANVRLPRTRLETPECRSSSASEITLLSRA